MKTPNHVMDPMRWRFRHDGRSANHMKVLLIACLSFATTLFSAASELPVYDYDISMPDGRDIHVTSIEVKKTRDDSSTSPLVAHIYISYDSLVPYRQGAGYEPLTREMFLLLKTLDLRPTRDISEVIFLRPKFTDTDNEHRIFGFFRKSPNTWESLGNHLGINPRHQGSLLES